MLCIHIYVTTPNPAIFTCGPGGGEVADAQGVHAEIAAQEVPGQALAERDIIAQLPGPFDRFTAEGKS